MATKLPSELRPREHWVLFLTVWLFINVHSSALHPFSSWAVCLFMLPSCKSSSLYSRHKPHINAWFEQFLPFYKFLVSIIWIKMFKVGSRLFGRFAFCLFFPFEIGSPTAQTGPELNTQSKLPSKSHPPTSIFQSQGSRQGHYTQEGFKSDMSALRCLCFPCFGVLRDHVNEEGGVLSQAFIIWGSAWPLISLCAPFMFAMKSLHMDAVPHLLLYPIYPDGWF